MIVPKFCRALFWFLFWFLLISALYWSGFGAMPQRDHTYFMLGRYLEVNDMVWLVKSLAYSRTNLLLPGDYFAFRPMHMLVLALNDILFRYHFTAQAIVCCSIASLAATSFFVLAKRIAGLAVAGALTFFWISQLVGAEIVLWKHITPFLLLPAFFCISLLVLTDGPLTKSSALHAGGWVFLASMTHEAGCAVALLMAGLMLLIREMEPKRRKSFILIFAVPALIALSINALDYFLINPPPSGWVTLKSMPADTLAGFARSFLTFLGSLGVAFFSPGLVTLNQDSEGFLYWYFGDLPRTVLVGYAVLTIFVVIVLVWRIFRYGVRSGSEKDVVLFFSMALFVNSFGMSAVRIYSRGISYMSNAGYQYSMILLALCGMSMVFFVHPPRKVYLKWFLATVVMALGGWQAVELRSQLNKTAPGIQAANSTVSLLRSLYTVSPAYCYDGFDITRVQSLSWWPNSVLFQDVSCEKRPAAQPTYATYISGAPALALLYTTRVSTELIPLKLTLEERYAEEQDNTKTETFVTGTVNYGYPIDFYVATTKSFDVGFRDINANEFGFNINKNVISTYDSESKIATNTYYMKSEKKLTHYNISYLYNRMILYVNEQPVSYIPVDGKTGDEYNMYLWSKKGLSVESIQYPRIAKKSHIDSMEFIPLNNLPAQ